jgi:hypothetical protein
VIRELRGGQTQVGAVATSVQRRLGGTGLEGQLRSAAWTGGLDVSHEFFNRSWSAAAQLAFSHVTGSTGAMLRTQQQSSRYFQRPDAEHIGIDSTRTSLSGYALRVEVGRRAGLHWRGDASFSATSPGFEINDIGFQTGADRVTAGGSLVYVQSTPTQRFRSYRISAGPELNWNHGGDFVGGRVNVGANWQFLNFWGASINANKRIVGYDDRLTRGGPLARDRHGQSVGGMISTDPRRTLSARLNGNVAWGEDGGGRLSANVSMRPAEWWSMTVGPSYSRSTTLAQYVTAVTDALNTSTYGRRYIFTELDQTTVSMETRLNVNFSPTLSFELFAQPFIATADYGAPRELAAARGSTFLEYGRDIGTVAYDSASRVFRVDPDGAGPARPFAVPNRDFHTVSLRGNAVLRWEYRPGSTLYIVAQQRRADYGMHPELDLLRDTRGMFRGPAATTLVIKASYWLNR